MKIGRFSVSHIAAAVSIVLFAVFVVGCGSLGGPQNTFAPKGEVADKQRDLFVITSAIGLVVLIGVFGALGYIVVRFRRRDGDPLPKQVHGNTRLEIGWTVAPALVLLGLAVPTVLGIIDLGTTPNNAMHMRVHASQWDWSFEYLDPEFAQGDKGLTVKACPADVGVLACMYVPVGRPVDLEIQSSDVNHSFWIPKVAGKTDAIAGRTNEMWLKADEVGIFHGQCAEFCGIGHPIMKLALIALEPDQFTACMQAFLAGTEDDSACSPPAGSAG